MITMPDTVTRAADLTPEQVAEGRRRLPKVQLRFVERECPEALAAAKRYDRALERFLHHPAGGPGEGYAFDPKLYRAACRAFDRMMEQIPEHLH